MRFSHLSKSKKFVFDADRLYEPYIGSDEEDEVKASPHSYIAHDFPPRGLWMSPETAVEGSCTYESFAQREMSCYRSKVYFEIPDSSFVKWTASLTPGSVSDNNKILVIEPEDVPSFSKIYLVKGSWGCKVHMGQIKQNYAGIMFRPYNRAITGVYAWYHNLDGESVCVWNLSIVMTK